MATERFTVHHPWDDDGLKRLLRCKNAGAFAVGAERYPLEGAALVDEQTNAIIFTDDMEPEDATLGRDLRPLVDLLNRVTLDDVLAELEKLPTMPAHHQGGVVYAVEKDAVLAAVEKLRDA